MKKEISFQTLYEKVLGGWIGKSLGGIVGAPVECHKVLGNFTSSDCWPDTLYPNDDLDIQVVWLELLEEYGSRVTSKEMADIWQERCWYNFSEYGFFLYNRQRGIEPPLSGKFNNWFCKECMGCPIRSEIWGMFGACNPLLAAKMARYDGELDHTGVSVEAERFFAAAEAEAFCAKDLNECLQAGLSVLSSGSSLRAIYDEVQELYAKYQSLEGVHLPLMRRFGHRDYSKVEINFAFTLLSLLVGGGDMKETIVAAINCGWDSDCTAATAGSLLGILHGAQACPKDWVEKMGERLDCDVNVRHKNALLTEFAYDTCLVIAEGAQTVNRKLKITNIPQEAQKKVEERLKSRSKPKKVRLRAIYRQGLSISSDTPTEISVQVTNRGDAFQGKVCVNADADLQISCPQTVEVVHGASKFVLSCTYTGKELRDKNLIQVKILRDKECVAELNTGLIGARPWLIYGPYFDIYDHSKFDKNPYRNEEVITHPNHIPGNFEVMVHNYVYKDQAYLNEKELLKQDLPSERPLLVYTEEDRLTKEEFGGFEGESCYYVVREVICPKDHDCLAVFSCCAPLTVWADGEKVYEKEEEGSCGLLDIRIPVTFRAEKPMRFVAKVYSRTDARELSMFFVEHFTEDKSRGVSFALDCMRYVKPAFLPEETKKYPFRG